MIMELIAYLAITEQKQTAHAQTRATLVQIGQIMFLGADISQILMIAKEAGTSATKKAIIQCRHHAIGDLVTKMELWDAVAADQQTSNMLHAQMYA